MLLQFVQFWRNEKMNSNDLSDELNFEVLRSEPVCHFHAAKWFCFICILNTNLHCSWIFLRPTDWREQWVWTRWKHTSRYHIHKNSLNSVFFAYCNQKSIRERETSWECHCFPPEQSWEWKFVNALFFQLIVCRKEWNLIAATLINVSRNKVHYTLPWNSSRFWTKSTKHVCNCFYSWEILFTNLENISCKFNHNICVKKTKEEN